MDGILYLESYIKFSRIDGLFPLVKNVPFHSIVIAEKLPCYGEILEISNICAGAIVATTFTQYFQI